MLTVVAVMLLAVVEAVVVEFEQVAVAVAVPVA